MVIRIFKIAFRLTDRHVFMWQSQEIFNAFKTSTLKQIFWKTKNCFKKLEYHFLVKSSKTETAAFPYKTALPEANVKTNRMEVQNGPIKENGVLPVTTLFFENVSV